MMVDLILTVCMVTNPESCREERLSFQARQSLAQCVMLSAPYVAQWAGDHPNWTVKRWECGWPDEREQKI
ncbi:hypothetical protein FP2506_12414 [Fulvimarina pelagi HTCC2506]|uniref:Uncharacterized protein n=2 Tax=Fulvimarina pelagi TaxID=217511 RepID=Q0G1L3_9HYPH|nr:hypothetical protein [Fulvimarina pelagi]EAU41068.1 hypothetical protein FP2506_12414 [Fulvimarina pelagi HTCC2506]BAT30918.1 hypothetical protein [Fulvimarina pelagi]